MVRQHRFVRSVLVAAILVLFASALHAKQPEGFLSSPPEPSSSVFSDLTSSSKRTVISLNGTWEYSEDDGDSWQKLTVPSCYVESDRFRLRRTFTIPANLLKNYRWELVGYGIQYSGSIYLNKSFIVQREGLIPFRAMIPEEISLQSTNTLEVEIDNQLDYSNTVPGRRLPLDVKTYGGIVRDIFIIGVPKVHIDDVVISRTKGGAPRFDVNLVAGQIKGLRVSGASDTTGSVGGVVGTDRADFTVSVTLESPKVNDTTPAAVAGRAEQVISLQSKRTSSITLSPDSIGLPMWAPGSPTMITARIQVRYNGGLVDERLLRFGNRSLRARGNRLYLNDSAITLQGVIYIEDAEDVGGSLSYEQMKADIEEIRDMGANLVRFSGGVPHPYLLQLCDQYGLLAFIDIPIGSVPSLLNNNDKFIERSIDRARATIEATRSYSSVVGYGIGFPIGFDASSSLPLVKALNKTIDSMKTGSLFYAVSHSWKSKAIRDAVDLVGISSLDGNVSDVTELIDETVKAVGKAKPIVLLAFGKLVRLGNEGGYADSTSTQSQAKHIGDVLTAAKKAGIAGYIYWSFNDYRTDRPLLTVNNDDQFIASSGLMTLDRQMRISGKMLTAIYTDQKAPDLAIGEYSAPSTVLFIGIGILCAILFLLLINNSRRFRENVFRALLRPYNFYADIRDQRILSTLQTTLLALVISATFAVIFSSLFYYYRMDEAFDFVLSVMVTSDSLKSTIDYLIWRPVLAVLAFTAVFFLMLLSTALLIRFFSFFVRNKIFFNDAYTIAVWGALPVLLLIPLAMILYRLLELPGAGAVAFTLVLGVLCWMLYRVLRGTSVVYDIRSSKIYLYVFGSILAIILILYVTSGNVAAMIGYLGEGIGSLYSRG